VRVFVALDIPEDVRCALGVLIDRLSALGRGARWARPESLHVTLKFIGEVSDEKVGTIRDALGRIPPMAPVEMRFRGTGFFPSPRRPRVFWARIEAGPELAVLAAAVEAALEPLGIPGEQRDFKPHLTLARFKTDEGLAALREELARAGAAEFGVATATAFHLYQSILRPSGAEYVRQASFPLVGGAR
jgi:RNA 2',3'-cyclic 3'-phosphodiesterase